jgi:hypothetical protein
MLYGCSVAFYYYLTRFLNAGSKHHHMYVANNPISTMPHACHLSGCNSTTPTTPLPNFGFIQLDFKTDYNNESSIQEAPFQFHLLCAFLSIELDFFNTCQGSIKLV